MLSAISGLPKMSTDSNEKLAIGLCLVLAVLLSIAFVFDNGHGWYASRAGYLDATYHGWANFTGEKPFVYRALIPLLMRGLSFILPIYTAASLIFICLSIISYFVILQLFRLWHKDEAYLHALMCFIVLNILLVAHKKPYDYGTIVLFPLAFYLLARKRFGWYLLLFPVITLNRETSFLLIGAFAFYAYDILPRGRFAGMLVLQVITWLGIYGGLIWIFRDSPGSSIVTSYDPITVYFQTPLMLLALPALWLVIRTIHKKWGKLTTIMQVGVMIFVWQIVLHLLAGYPFEFRVLAESFPIMYAAIID